MKAGHKSGVLDRLRKVARTLDDEHWITAHPNGKGEKGTPLLISGSGSHYTVVGGAGGKLNGKVVNPGSKSKARPGSEGKTEEPKGGEAAKEPAPQEPTPAKEPAKTPAQEAKKHWRPPHTPAKTTKEAAANAMKHDLADHADFGKLHVDVANALMESLHRHVSEFPRLRDDQHMVGSTQTLLKRNHEHRTQEYVQRLVERGYDVSKAAAIAARFVKKTKTGGTTWAFSMSGSKNTNGVAFSEKYGSGKALEQLQSSLKANVESKWHPIGCDTVKSIADHEYGHQLDRLLGLGSHPDVKALQTEAYGGVEGIYTKHGASARAAQEAMGNAVSRYANSNISEFIAEAWAEANNNPNPRPIAKRLAEIVRREYAQKYE